MTKNVYPWSKEKLDNSWAIMGFIGEPRRLGRIGRNFGRFRASGLSLEVKQKSSSSSASKSSSTFSPTSVTRPTSLGPGMAPGRPGMGPGMGPGRQPVQQKKSYTEEPPPSDGSGLGPGIGPGYGPGSGMGPGYPGRQLLVTPAMTTPIEYKKKDDQTTTTTDPGGQTVTPDGGGGGGAPGGAPGGATPPGPDVSQQAPPDYSQPEYGPSFVPPEAMPDEVEPVEVLPERDYFDESESTQIDELEEQSVEGAMNQDSSLYIFRPIPGYEVRGESEQTNGMDTPKEGPSDEVMYQMRRMKKEVETLGYTIGPNGEIIY